jgi:hypothetical protein
MGKVILFLISVFVFSSCELPKQEKYRYRPAYVCNCKEKEKLEEFLSNTIKDANNMSDEEMEDVIPELRTSGVKTFCSQRLLRYKVIGDTWEVDFEKYQKDSCFYIMEEY